ncbi:MAG: efflux RND transporter periplasmic adaptor subunit [Pseudomonadota bacterium]|nr:efflux RND transporter periplasmic adaptor subunit [Pseudomonadota bacterium]
MPRLCSVLPPLLLSATLLGLAGCNSTADDQQPAELARVRVATAVTGPAAPSIRTNGLLVNEDEIRLAFKVGGVIRRLSVTEGEQVRKGQKLAEIEQAEIDAQVEQAAQAHEKARRDLERGERLYTDKVISLEQLQDLRTQLAVNEAALNSTKFNRSYAAIVAPHDGTVLRRLAEERELVQAGDPILVLGAKDKGFVVRTGLADREIVQVKLGDSAQIRLDALPGQTFRGEVTEVSGASDVGSGMFGIEVSLDPVDVPLKSGLVAKLTITPASAKAGERVYVPISAIVEGSGRTARVFVLDQKHARRREVAVAFIEGETVALASGLQAGEQVVTDGAQYLEDGEEVTLAEPVAANRE